jgi:hypothetical protein
MGNILLAPCSGRQVSQLFPNNVENYLQHLKNTIESSPNSEIAKYNMAISNISNIIIETFNSINKLGPKEPTLQENIGETLHNIIYNSSSPLSPYCQTHFLKQENTVFEIFKYADNITYYAGYCTGENHHDSRKPTDSILSIKRISAVPQGSGLMLVSVGQEYVKMLEGHFDKGEFVQGHIVASSYFYIGGYSTTGFTGTGKLFYTDGQIFKGNFINGKLNGEDCMIYKPGEYYYKGACVESCFEGEGDLKYLSQHSQCVHYNGQFKSDLPDGNGIMEYRNKMKYEGQWSSGKFHGRGKLSGSDEEYVGEFQHGLKNGKGVLSKSNIMHESFTEKYDGEWKGDEKHGRGSVTFMDEKGNQCVKVGFWKYNKLDKYVD